MLSKKNRIFSEKINRNPKFTNFRFWRLRPAQRSLPRYPQWARSRVRHVNLPCPFFWVVAMVPHCQNWPPLCVTCRNLSLLFSITVRYIPLETLLRYNISTPSLYFLWLFSRCVMEVVCYFWRLFDKMIARISVKLFKIKTANARKSDIDTGTEVE